MGRRSLQADIDVLIVGGGLSGLVTAARVIKKEPTLKIVLLEAQTLGGQIVTDTDGELGARWISAEQIHIQQLCQEYKIKLKKRQELKDDKPFKDYSSVDDEEGYSFLANTEIKLFLNEINIICSDLHCGEYYKSTMEQFICKKLLFEKSREFMRLIVRSTAGVGTKDITIYDFLNLCRSTMGITNQIQLLMGKNAEYPEHGWKQLIDKIFEKIDPDLIISTNTKILRVLQSTENIVTVETSNEIYHTSVLVLALPWHEIMKIDFSPQIPRELRVVEPRIRNMMTSFIVIYSQPHWKAKKYSGNVISHRPQMVCYEIKPNTLSGILYHSLEREATEIKSICLNRLAEIFGNQMLTPITWKERTCEQPIYLNVPPTSAWNRIIWSSTNTGTLYRGYLNGAVQGGLRAALLTLLELRPQSVHWQDLNEIHWESFVKKEVGFFDRLICSVNLYNTLFNGTIISLCILGCYYYKNK